MIRLVIADDHTVLRQALCDMLTQKGCYEIIGQAGDGEELLQLLQTRCPDVVIMDVNMPKLGGVQALERLSQEQLVPPVLVLSADDGERNVRTVLKAGARGFMPKNAGIEELQFAIESLLKGKTYLSPSITAQLMGEGDKVNENPLSVLTAREIEILKHLADGKANRAIGKILHISTRTVDTHRSNILKKLNLKTNAELVKVAIVNGLVSV